MGNVLIVAYLLIVLALVTIILLQRSEGGGLGMGGGGGNSFMSVRGSANMLTRATGILAALFFALAIGLTLINSGDRATQNIVDRAATPTNTTTAPGTESKPAPTPSVLDALNAAQAEQDGSAPAPPTTAPAETAPAPTAPAASTSAPANAPDLALPANDNATAPAPAAGAAAAPTTSPAPASSTPTGGDGAGSGTPATPAPADAAAPAPAQPASN